MDRTGKERQQWKGEERRGEDRTGVGRQQWHVAARRRWASSGQYWNGRTSPASPLAEAGPSTRVRPKILIERRAMARKLGVRCSPTTGMISANDAERVSRLSENDLLRRLPDRSVLSTSTTHEVSRRRYRWCPVDVVAYSARLAGISVDDVVTAVRDRLLVESVMLS